MDQRHIKKYNYKAIDDVKEKKDGIA